MAQKLSPQDRAELEKALKEAFNSFDTDKSGQIDCKEFENVLVQYNASPECKKKMDPAKIKNIASDFIKVADQNADGKVNYQEFLNFMLEALGCK